MELTLNAKLGPSRAAIWGVVLVSPGMLFLAANFLNEVGIGFLYTLIEPLIVGPFGISFLGIGGPVLFLGGIVAALLVNALAMLQLDLRWEQHRLTGRFVLDPHPGNVALIAFAVLMLAFLTGYFFVENFRLVPTHL